MFQLGFPIDLVFLPANDSLLGKHLLSRLFPRELSIILLFMLVHSTVGHLISWCSSLIHSFDGQVWLLKLGMIYGTGLFCLCIRTNIERLGYYRCNGVLTRAVPDHYWLSLLDLTSERLCFVIHLVGRGLIKCYVGGLVSKCHKFPCFTSYVLEFEIEYKPFLKLKISWNVHMVSIALTRMRKIIII